jgi:hypothetical protein
LADVSGTFGWHFDADARVFYIPSWWRWNPPENENVLKGNLKDLNEIPPCALVEAFARNLETLPPTFHQTFVECCRIRMAKPSPNQEQKHYQDPEHEQEREHGRAPRAAAPNGNGHTDVLIGIARETMKVTSEDASMDELSDHFRYLARNKVPFKFTKAEELNAINIVLSERRAMDV